MPNSAQNRKELTRVPLFLGLIAVLLFFAASGFIAYSNTSTLKRNSELVASTHNTLLALNSILSTIKDAETGQRGFILTGDKNYLVPYNTALDLIKQRMDDLEKLTKNIQYQQDSIKTIRQNVEYKFRELAETIELRQNQGFNAALDVVKSDRGKEAMDNIREEIARFQEQERIRRVQAIEEMERAYRTAIVSGLLAAISGAILSIIVAFLLNRALVMRKHQDWLQLGQVGLGSAMLGDLRVEQLGDNVLKFLSDYIGAHVGVFFVRNGNSFKRVASYGVPAANNLPDKFTLEDGLLGQAAKDNKTFTVHDVPDGYLTYGSSLGQDKPRHLIIAPASIDQSVNAVIEIGFHDNYSEATLQLLKEATEAIGVAVRAADYRAHLQNLLEETQRQAEELQAQSEELRVSNEELEEQSRALKESQARLEQQQIELEQSNTQLEEQTQQLENQKEDLERINVDVLTKARQLEQASQYKSDFLANMSHELRTPLNSSLILAKLLADNTQGNLTEEQVKFAQTIQSAGNDLLTLINDILDLSKIEAGHMDIKAETVRVSRLGDDLNAIFKPLSREKNLEFKIVAEEGCPETIETDRQRLEQVLKNLLSNAFKFTESGSVTLSIGRKGNNVSFAVTDTGVGIVPEQQQAIFEAFRQADSTISRKYGGTGLGLSISRELTRLLGGSISLASEAGKGSTFTITLPQIYSEDAVQPRIVQTQAYISDDATERSMHDNSKARQEAPVRGAMFEDDRERVTSNSRSILVIEDDQSFAKILFDLAHELNFLCLVANTAEEGLTIAKQYLPSAVLLDVGLPDNSGLSVLDRLKRNTHTRHIPVHVVSADDYTQTALSLGAVGYMLKPVKREEIFDVFLQMEHRMLQKMHRVLLVEDDKIQRESVSRLLGSKDVDIVGVATATECLERLKENTYDCMILDLSLPDASGYTLLETLSQEDTYAFPPVIVYTGRDLSADEEQKLRRYSKSIIIKGAKSPERLLDEVTLFLHQVVSELPVEQQKMLQQARNRDAVLEGRRILVVEDDVRNVYSLTNILEPRGAIVEIARNGQEALSAIAQANDNPSQKIDLVLMDVMMPVMDGLTATREIRKQKNLKKLPIIMLTAKAMKDDQERCLDAGANDYMAKPLDVEKLLSLVRVWMPR